MLDFQKYGIPAAAAVIGAILGFLIAPSGIDEEDMVARLEALNQRIEELSDAKNAEAASAVAAIEQRTAALADAVGTLEAGSVAVAAEVSGLKQQVGTLADRVSGVATKVDGVSGAVAGSADEIAALSGKIEDVAANLAAFDRGAGAPARAAEPAAAEAAPAESAAGSSTTQHLAAAMGDGGLILGVGETGAVGDRKVFVSRLAGDTAHLMVVGDGRAEVERFGGPLDLGNGCTLTLVGIADDKAYLKPEC